MVQEHHRNFCLEESLALPEADSLGLASVGCVTLCANIATFFGVPVVI